MNTFWLKIAGLAVVVVVAIVLIGVLRSGPEPEPEEAPKTIYDQWEEDDKKLMAEPQFREPPPPTAPVPPTQAVTPEATSPVPPPQPVPVQPTVPAQPPVPQFEQLSMEDDIQAQRLWIWVENQRKMGRLPVMGYGQMVKACREIIQRWPRSKYAFFAKRALADLPERYHRMYNITKEEIDLGNLK